MDGRADADGDDGCDWIDRWTDGRIWMAMRINIGVLWHRVERGGGGETSINEWLL